VRKEKGSQSLYSEGKRGRGVEGSKHLQGKEREEKWWIWNRRRSKGRNKNPASFIRNKKKEGKGRNATGEKETGAECFSSDGPWRSDAFNPKGPTKAD